MANEGDLRIWYVPQVPGKAFKMSVDSVKEGHLVLDILYNFSLFESENRIKPDYADAGGIEIYESDGTGGLDWFDYDE